MKFLDRPILQLQGRFEVLDGDKDFVIADEDGVFGGDDHN